jgi:hypothetical protein
MEPTSKGSGPARASAARRYGPLIGIVAIVAIVAIVVAVAGGGGDDDGTTAASTPQVSTKDAWPFLTEDNADAEDWGKHCDEETGNVAIPWTYAAPCAKQLEGDNGGDTATGVTGDAIKVVVYQSDPAKNPLQAATVRGSGAEVDPATARTVYTNFVDMFQQYYNTYGRKIDLQFFTGSGGPMDEVAARADAKAIADMKPFAVLNGANQTPVWSEEIAANGIMCLGYCSLAVPQQTVEDNDPYLAGIGPTPEQAGQLTAQLVINQLKGKPAEYAGEGIEGKDRVFGVAHYNTVDNQQGPAFDVLRTTLEKGGVPVRAEQEFQLDLARGQEQARTVISKMKDAGVTTIILTGDPLTPQNLTKEATAQNYFPEWVVGSNVLIDTAIFSRTYDQEQWQHAIGLNLSGGRVNEEANQTRALYEWYTGRDPENNTYGVILPDIAPLVAGIHLAGPDLTPETFSAALDRLPPRGGNAIQPMTSRGEHGIWPTFDWGGIDDAAIMWWNPEAEGEDEVGVEGDGLWEFTDEGARYSYGEIPKGDIGLFEEEGSVTIWTTVPPDAKPPSYPSPAK